MAAPSKLPSPAVQMREMLSSRRRFEIEFDVAWDKSWQRVRWPHDTTHRRQWKAVLRETRAVWESAYMRAGGDPTEGTFQALDLQAA